MKREKKRENECIEPGKKDLSLILLFSLCSESG